MTQRVAENGCICRPSHWGIRRSRDKVGSTEILPTPGAALVLKLTLLERCTLGKKKPLAVIKVAFSGTGLRRDWDHTDPGESGACYRSLISEIRTAIEAAKKDGIELRPRSFGWVQGESDANANDSVIYAQNLNAMLTSIRKELNVPKLAALIAVNTRFLEGRNQFVPVIIEQQKMVASFDPRWEYVDTSAATIANQVHYDSKGTLEVGRLFAESLFEHRRKNSASTATSNDRHAR